MKNVDVPLWDKGDNTDDFSKGGGRSGRFNVKESTSEKVKKIEKVFKRVLGRKPTSREISYYKYSSFKEDEVVNNLLKSEEFKKNLKKIEKYPVLEESNRKAKMTILKLKNNLSDQEKEYEELNYLLKEKNSLIKTLRKENKPYGANSRDINDVENDTFIEVSKQTNNTVEPLLPVKILFKEEGLINRVIKLFKK